MKRSIAGGLIAVGGMLFGLPAHAGIEACGNIDVEAKAECKVEVSGGCVAKCEPVNFTAACAGELYGECKGDCDLDVGDCNVTCEGTCTADCVVEPGDFDCEGSCNGSCEADCSGKCDSSDSQCEAACKATCSGECSASCEGTPVEASCDAKCKGSCEGSCEARANLDCQIDCQAMGHLECAAKLEGGCKAACEQPDGALFCDGQYVDHGGNLDDCIDALKAELDIEVDASARGSCSGNKCEGEAEASVSCGVAKNSGGASDLTGIAALGLFGMVARRRSRARQ
jgi:hypothetical protein